MIDDLVLRYRKTKQTSFYFFAFYTNFATVSVNKFFTEN